MALQNTGGNTPDGSGSGSSANQGVPSWLKIALVALIGGVLLGVAIWYGRTWKQEPEEDG